MSQFFNIFILGKELFMYFFMFLVIFAVLARITFLYLSGYSNGDSSKIFSFNFDTTANSFYSMVVSIFLLENTAEASSPFLNQLPGYIFFWIIVGLFIKFTIYPILIGGFFFQYSSIFIDEVSELIEKYPPFDHIIDEAILSNRTSRDQLQKYVNNHFKRN